MIEIEKWITQSTVLKMGFTKGMISRLLSDPKEVPNPNYKSAAKMKLWPEREVIAAMESEEFIQMRDKSARRRDSAKKAVAAKRDKTMDMIRGYTEGISVTVIDEERLIKRTLQAKREWYNYQAAIRDNFDYFDFREVDIETLQRWVVNYIRHNLVKYDPVVDSLIGRVGKQEAYCFFKNAVLDKISEAYPKYSEECNRQKLDM
uniref:Uncharacterized protein n=1 Tax=Dulem virus 39 TaxID=3145757 RepID=A0AAU8B6H9_9CAUD